MVYFAYPPRQEGEHRNDTEIQATCNELLSWIHLDNVNGEKGKKGIFLDQIKCLAFPFDTKRIENLIGLRE
jgi:hypothetical protein